MRKKLTILGLCAMAALTIVACGSPSETTPTIEPTNKVTNEPTSEPISEVPSVTPSEEATPSPTPSEEPTPSPTPSEEPTPTPSETPTPTPSETPTPTPSVVPDNSSNDDGENNDSEKEETSSSSESVTTPEENSSSSEVIVPPVEDDEPNTPSAWDGGYDNLPSDGFDHIKVPTIDDFYDEGLDNPGGAFDFGNRPEWEEAWYDAYDEFLVALGSPVDDEGNVYPAFMSINPGYTQGYQYLYYGVNWSDDSNGWGDIVIYPGGLYGETSSLGDERFNAYFIELSNFTFGNMDKGLEDEYRAALSMMLAWCVPNPQEVEKAIYDAFVEDHSVIFDHWKANGYFSWVQVGEVDVCVIGLNTKTQAYTFAIRNHK